MKLSTKLSDFLRLCYRYVCNPKVRGSVCILENPNGEILLVQHTYGNQKVWTFPGGGCKSNHETHQQCIIREIQEELGLNILPKEIGHYLNTKDHRRDTVYFYHQFTDNQVHVNTKEIKQTCWFSSYNLPPYLSENVKQGLLFWQH